MLARRTLLRSYSVQHNQAIIDLLRRYREEEERKPERNGFKVHAFSQAIHAVSKVEHPIRLGNDVRLLPGIGPGIMMRINEFLYADEAMESKHPALQEEVIKSRAITALQIVPGIGATTAKKLFEAGCTSLADLRSPQFRRMLTAKQAANIKYMGHLDQPISREDAEDLLNFCRENLDTRYEITLVGDYRRGSSAFNEIDVMVSHPDFVHVPLPTEPSPYQLPIPKEAKSPRKRRKPEEKQTNLLQTELVPVLEHRGLVGQTLTCTLKSWQGIVRLPEQRGDWGIRSDRLSGIENVQGRFRRLNIHFIPQKSRGSSLLFLTGDSEFHAHVCHQAKQSGMLFNEYGLWRWTLSESCPPSSDADTIIPETTTEENLNKGYWSLINSETEADIFDELGMDYVDPTKRNFLFVSGKARSRMKRVVSGSVISR